MATCVAIETKPLTLERSADDGTTYALIAGIKSTNNVHQTYNEDAADESKCMDGNDYPVLVGGASTDITYGSSALTVFMTKTQHAQFLTDLGAKTKLDWKISYQDGSTSEFKAKVTNVSENHGEDFLEEAITLTKTTVDTFVASA
jgi:hypothetical protein